MRFMFACGGTGGHINPALAVARLVKEKRPNAQILFVGASGGMEEKLVPAAGFELKTVDVSSISRKKGIKSLLDNVKAVQKAYNAQKQAKKLICEFAPDIVVGTGGYACFPVLSSASKLSIPTIVHEANAYPGLATRLLAGKVTRVLLNFEAASRRLPKRACCVTVGYPVRGDILMYDREKARRELNVEKPLVVSFWGSLGAREMNRCIVDFMRIESSDGNKFHHIHATGRFGYEWMPSAVAKTGIDLRSNDMITLREYIDDMPRVLAAADVVMCRGGAGTLSEIGARGTPAIIIPSPNVTDNHQFKNAQEMSAIGGALVIEEKDVTAKLLYDTVISLIDDEEKRRSMSENLIKNSNLDATERIYSEMMKVIKK
ncbi:MAG: UDP-N-acetylglucosamine--N-acetylmuramyl-(pentapeptide) pyrophosphoryl-undecaprenol N-acetylglucosamine transferase [Oscillospiraceae bacterium]|nr:UDP-N-acetylglucosamine--N-acetylmuramyl-(pentapeptide) pyrophosphoryl-undecaprenol N-acetylglucosamine transferase [Oscillospiraceae bacterium]